MTRFKEFSLEELAIILMNLRTGERNVTVLNAANVCILIQELEKEIFSRK